MKIVIIGGGASGCMAAIKAAQNGADVTLIEKSDRIGKKILVTGNGKCNLSNLSLDVRDYVSESSKKDDFVQAVFSQFGNSETCGYFRTLGLLTKAREELVYPLCGQASAVLDTLRYQLQALHVKIETECMISNVTKKDSFIIQTSKGDFRADRVIVCCGGKAAPKTGSDGSFFPVLQRLGHHFSPMYPALVQLQCEGDFFGKVSGVRFDGEITVTGKDKIWKERGEVQMTDHGISGIPTFQLSLAIAPELVKNKMEGYLDFVPELSDTDILKELLERKKNWPSQFIVEEVFSGIVHKKVLLQLLKLCQIKPQGIISEVKIPEIHKLAELIKKFPIRILRSNSFEQAQVSRGGIRLEEIKENLESAIVPGLFFAGELIDVTGKCGGYNLQWAWSSAYLAASNCSASEAL